MIDATIVAVVTPNYLERFKISYATWHLKSQLDDLPLALFVNGDFKESDFNFIDDRPFDIHYWQMDNADTKREEMLSAFVMGPIWAEIQTEYYIKIDADAFFIDNTPLFDENDFKYDLMAHRWGYTKPKDWIPILDNWCDQNGIAGESMKPVLNPDSNAVGHKRITSWVCLHKTDFVKEVCGYFDDKMPVPSHDTFLWYMSNRLPDRKWRRNNLKNRGVRHTGRAYKMRNELAKHGIKV